MREQEAHPVSTANSAAAAVPQLQTSDAFAAVAQLIQSSQGQQVSGMNALDFLHISLHMNTLGYFQHKKLETKSFKFCWDIHMITAL